MTDDEMRLKLADPEARVRVGRVLEQWSRLLGEMVNPTPPPLHGIGDRAHGTDLGRRPPPFPGVVTKPPAPVVKTVGEAPAWMSLPILPGSSRPR
jgi:hypothetical protein